MILILNKIRPKVSPKIQYSDFELLMPAIRLVNKNKNIKKKTNYFIFIYINIQN